MATEIKTKNSDAFDKPLLAWYAPDILRYQKGVTWYLIAGTINAVLIAYAIWTGSWTMTAVFVTLPLVYLLEQRRKPKMLPVILSEYGVKFGNIKVPYSNIKKFWIIHEPPLTDELHLLTDNKVHPVVTIQLMDTDPVLIRNFLITQVREWEGKKQSLLDLIIKLLRLA